MSQRGLKPRRMATRMLQLINSPLGRADVVDKVNEIIDYEDSNDDSYRAGLLPKLDTDTGVADQDYTTLLGDFEDVPEKL